MATVGLLVGLDHLFDGGPSSGQVVPALLQIGEILVFVLVTGLTGIGDLGLQGILGQQHREYMAANVAGFGALGIWQLAQLPKEWTE